MTIKQALKEISIVLNQLEKDEHCKSVVMIVSYDMEIHTTFNGCHMCLAELVTMIAEQSGHDSEHKKEMVN